MASTGCGSTSMVCWICSLKAILIIASWWKVGSLSQLIWIIFENFVVKLLLLSLGHQHLWFRGSHFEFLHLDSEGWLRLLQAFALGTSLLHVLCNLQVLFAWPKVDLATPWVFVLRLHWVLVQFDFGWWVIFAPACCCYFLGSSHLNLVVVWVFEHTQTVGAGKNNHKTIKFEHKHKVIFIFSPQYMSEEVFIEVPDFVNCIQMTILPFSLLVLLLKITRAKLSFHHHNFIPWALSLVFKKYFPQGRLRTFGLKLSWLEFQSNFIEL